LLYIYIVLHSHVKSYKYILFYIYIVLLDHIKLYKYIYFNTYMECKSQTIYTHNTIIHLTKMKNYIKQPKTPSLAQTPLEAS
jgi:hypothetical protein